MANHNLNCSGAAVAACQNTLFCEVEHRFQRLLNGMKNTLKRISVCGVDLKTAKKLIRDDGAGLIGWQVAATVIATDNRATLNDLFECLRRGKWTASTGAIALYRRTGRRRRRFECITDIDDWKMYIKKQARKL